MKNYLKFLLLLIGFQLAQGQNIVLNSDAISEELRQNANAVVRKSSTDITIGNQEELFVKIKRIITILNSKGDKAVDTYMYYDNNVRIDKLSAKIYSASGKELKKYAKSSFKDVSAVDGATMYSDTRLKYVEYTPISYPYTVIFECHYRTSTTGFIPKWYPLDSYNISVEKSEYTVHNTDKLPIRIKEKNFSDYEIKKTSDIEIHYLMEHQPAIKYERSGIPFVDIMPSVMVALNNFSLEGVSGYANDWNTFGKWMHENLLAENSVLNEPTISEVRNLVKDVTNDIDKARIIYDYVQNNTRYISVQVGIGGWEPAPAREVDKLGYGDCKGLVNYTHALLNAVGVTSYYSVVHAGNKRDIEEDFASIQGNHVILNIPSNGEDVWLECTSQTLPFGFLGSFTDDRKVLVVTPNGGIIKRTPAYKDQLNKQLTKARIQLDEKGNLKADIVRTSRGIQYNDKYRLKDKSHEDLVKNYKNESWPNLNNLEIESIALENNKEEVIFKEDLNVLIPEYGTLNSEELVIKTNIFNRVNYIPKRYRNRKLPFRIDHGYEDIEEYEIIIPEGYSIKALPEAIEITTKFGEYIATLEKLNSDTLLYERTLFIKSGTYNKEDYSAYRDFRKKIASNENLQISLSKH